MRHPIILCLVLAACSKPVDPPTPPPATNEPTAAAPQSDGAWQLLSESGGKVLRFADANQPMLVLMCEGNAGTLLVNAPGIAPIGSEERLSVGQGGTVAALVADPRGDPVRGGVSATGPTPANLTELLSGKVAVSYGAARVGPLPQPPAPLVRDFVAFCRPSTEPALPAPKTAACWQQDGEPIRTTPVRAIGTEPFWGARIEGRCVTYSTPEDQSGTRIWTRVTGNSDESVYEGAYAGKPFRLAIASTLYCSDGMSDEIYNLSAELIVGGETRRGCARYKP